MRESRKLVAFMLISVVLFASAGLLLYDRRPVPDANIEALFGALENPKVGQYYLNLPALGDGKVLALEVAKADHTLRACYRIEGKLLKRLAPDCKADISLKLDEHAMGSLILASYYPKSTLASEFLFGHVAVQGLSFQDMVRLL